jgi:pimeloyl-ACP methyl ester carboxylesterase
MSTGAPQARHFALLSLPELRSLKVFGRKICYYDVGRGPVLVMVHGLGADADVWAFCLEALSASHRVLALDLLGFGRSDKPLIDYHIGVFVEVLQGFLRSLGIERGSLLGNSLGAWIAAAVALELPNVVHKLILNNAVGLFAGSAGLPIDLNVSTRGHMREVLEFMFYNKAIVTDDFVDLCYEQHLERNDGYTIRSVLESCSGGSEALDQSLRQLKVPTLLLWGEHDGIVPLSVAESFHRLVVGSTLEVIPECGHLAALEKPDELVRRVLAFLK